MFRKTRLFTPGPTPLLPAAQFAMAAADMHHRTPEFRALYQRVLGQLRTFVGSKNDVILLTASGTGAMEASVSNLTSPGDRVLVLTAGKFGERWTGAGQGVWLPGGCRQRSLWPDLFAGRGRRPRSSSDTRAVLMQATETSTGVRHDVPPWRNCCAPPAAMPCWWSMLLPAWARRISIWMPGDWMLLIGGSQKAVMIPPGLAYLCGQRARMEAHGDDQKSALLF